MLQSLELTCVLTEFSDVTLVSEDTKWRFVLIDCGDTYGDVRGGDGGGCIHGGGRWVWVWVYFSLEKTREVVVEVKIVVVLDKVRDEMVEADLEFTIEMVLEVGNQH